MDSFNSSIFFFGLILVAFAGIEIAHDYLLYLRLRHKRFSKVQNSKDSGVQAKYSVDQAGEKFRLLRFNEIEFYGKMNFVITVTLLFFITALSSLFWITNSILIAFAISTTSSFCVFYFQIQYIERQRQIAIMENLPQAIDGLVRCLGSGLDLNKSLTIVADEASTELQSEFRYLLRNRDLGQSLGDAFDAMAHRLKSRDIAFLASLIAIQERSGGPLVLALESLSHILKDRERLRRKRMTASAEARMSALILGGLPVLVATALFTFNPSYRDVLIHTQSGRLFLLLALILLLIGSFVMYRMVRLDIR